MTSKARGTGEEWWEKSRGWGDRGEGEEEEEIGALSSGDYSTELGATVGGQEAGGADNRWMNRTGNTNIQND